MNIEKPTLTTGPFYRSAEVNESGNASSNTATTATISVGDEFHGQISSSSDSDWVAVDLVAGETYVFTVWGTGGSSSGLSDTTLTLRGATGSQISSNDDIGGGVTASQITYTATSTGTFYLDVGGYSTNTGNYILEAATNVYTVDQVINQITEYGWGNDTEIAFGSTSISVNLSALTADGRQLARWALDMWESYTGLEFTTVSSGGDITFDDNQSGAFAGPDSFSQTSGQVFSSTVNVGTSWLDTYGTDIGSYSFLTYMHEIGHALGLMHSGAYNGTATYGSDNHFLNDSYQMTIMSYFSTVDNTYIDGSNFLPITPMIADIAAIAQTYGAAGENTGNTVWGANSTLGGLLGTVFGIVFDGDADTSNIFDTWETDAGINIGLTIYDTGGIDTLDLSTMDMTQTVDLRIGHASDIGGETGNIVIAEGTIIENYVGGSGRETVYGNSANNDIRMGAGDDIVYGFSGDDSIRGGNGHDTIHSGNGHDTVLAGRGNDTVNGGNGNDSIEGNEGADALSGNSGHDRIFGGNGDDRLLGETGNDLFWGGAGHDSIEGGNGNDTVRGGDGNDRVEGNDGVDVLSGNSGHDKIFGGSSNDRIYGGTGNDKIWGGSGHDTIQGGNGNDSIQGGNGNDRIEGNLGTDTLSGGAGADVFVFTSLDDSPHGSARDTITDFTHDVDQIDLSGVMSGLTFIGTDTFTNTVGEIRYDDSLGRIHVDVDGDGTSDLSINITGAPTLDVGDLIL